MILIVSPRRPRAIMIVSVALVALALSGCTGETTPVDRAEAQVTLKQNAVRTAQEELAAASEAFCQSSETYVSALDRYGDVLNATAVTVGDVRVAGKDLAKPGDDAVDAAKAASEAQEALVVAEQELVNAQIALAVAQAGPSGAPVETPSAESTLEPPASAESVERVEQAEREFTAAVEGVTDQTSLTEASEQFNSAAVALEFAWLRLFADAGCIPEDQHAEAAAAVIAYTTTVQQALADAGYYQGAIDGVYGPETVAAVEALQEANGLPVTGTIDKATVDALHAQLEALAGADAQGTVAATAAVQQTLKLVGFWDAPVDGVWTPELTEALVELQIELGVEPTGTVDAATVTAFQEAIATLQQPAASPAPTPTPTEEP